MSLHLSDFFNIMAGHIIDSYLAADPEIKSISYDSRNVESFGLFFCKGRAFRTEFLHMAIEKGAVAFVIDNKGLKNFKELPDMPYILVDNMRQVLAKSAALFYDHPEKKLDIYAITGTKGKSSTAFYLKELMDYDANKKGLPLTGLISSIGIYDGESMQENSLTTPEPFELFAILDRAVKKGLKRLVIEVSSQALKYKRTAGIPFKGAAFLNIAPDHVSPLEHKDFADYFSSKLSIFKQAEYAFINMESDRLDEILAAARACKEIYLFALDNKAGAVITADNIEEGQDLSFDLHYKKGDEEEICRIRIPEIGIFTVENIMAASLMALKASCDLNNFPPALIDSHIPGRQEILSTPNEKIRILVDFAHNGLSFKALFKAADKAFPNRRKIVIFGSAGNKAINRRQDMARMAGSWADDIILTTDDPAFEEVSQINKMIAEGLGGKNYIEIENREEAVIAGLEIAKKAVVQDKKDALLLILGKGDDLSIPIKGKNIPYKGDANIAREWIEKNSQSEL